MEQRINVELEQNAYSIFIAPGILERLGATVQSIAPHSKAALFADKTVFAHYGAAVEHSLNAAGYQVLTHAFPATEEHKTERTVSELYDILVTHALERKSPVLALGGGVAGDVVGFVAATYLRGLPFFQVPTTLLAMVDASIGGKVAYNHPRGKNLIGAFYQPRAVFIDPAVLHSLPARDLSCGLAECIKHGVLGDLALFEWTEQHLGQVLSLKTAALVKLIAKNTSLKARIVAADEREQGQRALLNFGHTFAHAIEASLGYGTVRHGEAVSLGICAATFLAQELRFCPAGILARIEALLHSAGLPVRAKLPKTEQLMSSMALDKKVSGGKIRLVLPRAIGQCEIVSDVDAARIAEAWEYLRSSSLSP